METGFQTRNGGKMTDQNETSLDQARKDFLSFLKYTKGHSDTTCYNYNSDLGIWHRWLEEAKLDWQNRGPIDVEHFVSQ